MATNYLLLHESVLAARDIGALHEARQISRANKRMTVNPRELPLTVVLTGPIETPAVLVAPDRGCRAGEITAMIEDAGLTPDTGEGVYSGLQDFTETIGFRWSAGPEYVPIAVPVTDMYVPTASEARSAGKAARSGQSAYDDARAQRDDMIRAALTAGRTQAWCAEHFGVTRGRVNQIARG